MKKGYIVLVMKGGATVYQFSCATDKGRAAYLGGAVMDALCDYHGGDDWGYEVSPISMIQDGAPEIDLIRYALSRASV